jgi:hypothetical protein
VQLGRLHAAFWLSRFSGHDKHAPPTHCGTRLSGPFLGGTRLSRPTHDVGLPIALQRARQACPSDSLWNTLVRSVPRRDALVASDARRWIAHCASAGTTSMPLRLIVEHACQVRSSEGRACRVRGATFDNSSHFRGLRFLPNIISEE